MGLCDMNSLGASLHLSLLFFFNDPATTGIYTLSLHDALPIYRDLSFDLARRARRGITAFRGHPATIDQLNTTQIGRAHV